MKWERSLHYGCFAKSYDNVSYDAQPKSSQSGASAMLGRMNLADCRTLFILGGAAFAACALSTNELTPVGEENEELSRKKRAESVDAPRMNGEPTTQVEGQQV